MDVNNFSHVIKRLRPFVRDKTIQRSRFERALTIMKIPDVEVRLEIEQLLLDEGFTIEEDSAPGKPVSTPDEVPVAITKVPANPEQKSTSRSSSTSGQPAIVAARRRIERDRFTRDPARVLLKPEEEVGLALLIRGTNGKAIEGGGFARLQGEAQLAARCLLLHNQRLVRWTARKYATTGMDYEDLFQYGVIGLIRAVELFDPNRGYKFSTYASNWVRQAITRGIANDSRTIRIPIHMVERINKVWAARSRLTRYGEPPGVPELAVECQLSEEQIVECLSLGPHSILSLDGRVGSESERTLGDQLDLQQSSSSPENEVEFRMLRQLIENVLDTLDEREAGVIRLRYGLFDGEQWTLDQIAHEYNLSRERIRQIERATLRKLRGPNVSSILKSFT